MYKQLGVAAALVGLALATSLPRAGPGGAAAKTGAHPYLGVVVSPAPGDSEGQGVRVREVEPGSPAAKAGLRKGDVITRVDGREVEDPHALVNVLARHRPGETLTFQVMREGREKKLQVPLGQRRQSFSGIPPAGEQPEGRTESKSGAEKGMAFLGVEAVGMDELTPRFKKRMGISDEEGVVVLEVMPDSPAARAGLRHGDVITAVNGQKIKDAEQLRAAVRKAGAGKSVRLEVVRGTQKKEIDARLEEAPVGGFRMLPSGGLFDEGVNPLAGTGEGWRRAERLIERLERRVEDLEKRLNELEKGKSKSQK
jgi:predicted metalloprotease with PDZ domain